MALGNFCVMQFIQFTATDLKLNYSIGLRLSHKHLGRKKDSGSAHKTLQKQCGTWHLNILANSGSLAQDPLNLVYFIEYSSSCCLGTQWHALSRCGQHLGIHSISHLNLRQHRKI